MNELKKLTNPKNYQKFERKIVDKQFLMGKFYDANVSSLVSPACKDKHINTKKFPKSKMRKLLQLQLQISHKLNPKTNHEQKCKTLTSMINKQKQKANEKLNRQEQYDFYLPLHNLWQEYAQNLISKEKNQQSRQLRVLKADLHGAFITVIESKNQTLVGLEGIIVKQTLRTFDICSRSQFDQTASIKTVLKHICVFLLRAGNELNFIINGNSLVYRPSDRIKHKFKYKKAQKINMNFLQTIEDIKQDNPKE